MSDRTAGERPRPRLQAALAALWTHHRDDVVDLISEIRVFVESGLGAGDATAAAEAAGAGGAPVGRLARHVRAWPTRRAPRAQLEELIDDRSAGRRRRRRRRPRARGPLGRRGRGVRRRARRRRRRPPPTERAVRVIGLVGLDGTLATHISERGRAAPGRHAGVRRPARARRRRGRRRSTPSSSDIDRIHLDALGPGGWAPYAAAVRRPQRRPAARRSRRRSPPRRPPLPPAAGRSRRRARHRRVAVGADPPHPDGAGGR